MAAMMGGEVTAFKHPRPGVELDWLAVDIHGHIGLFSTGGLGPVPKAVVERLGEVDDALARLALLPVTGECADEPRGPGNFSFWIEPSRRGIYGFDWGPVHHGEFTQLTTPAAPITAAEISDDQIRAAAGLVWLPIAFEEARHLLPEALGVDLFGDDVD